MKANLGTNNGGLEVDRRSECEEAERLRKVVLTRVRRYGFTDADADRVVDDIHDAWSQFGFDPEKANGAKPETVLFGLIANRCKTAMRGLLRSRARDSQYSDALMADKNDQPLQRDVPLRLDVQEALSRLSERERIVCEALANDVPEQRICERLGINWYGLKEIVDGIRSRFTALGLHEWLER